MAKITIQHPDGTAAKFGLNQQVVTIGRAENNDIRLRDGASSTYHAVLKQTDSGDFLLTDLDSTNGTKVNGARVQQQMLRHGDQIHFGDTAAFYESSAVPVAFDDQPTQIYDRVPPPPAAPQGLPPPPPQQAAVAPVAAPVPVIVRRQGQESGGGCFALIILCIGIPAMFVVGMAMRHSSDHKGSFWEYIMNAMQKKPYNPDAPQSQSRIVTVPDWHGEPV